MRGANDRAGLRLAPDTENRLRELLAGRACCRCGSPAERFSAERYYCAAHFLRQGGQEGEGSPRVYRCPAGLAG